MLCLECGAEMRLVQVTKDTTMLVPGYEHHTWQCTSCSTVEQRMTFTREKAPRQGRARRSRAGSASSSCQHGNPPRLRDELMQDFEPLYVQLRGKNAHPRRIAARPGQAGREAAAHHVVSHRDDRDGRTRALCRAAAGVAECDNEIATFWSTSSPASAGARSFWPSVQTNRKRTLRPSSQPITLM